MKHLAERGIPVPRPAWPMPSGALLHTLTASPRQWSTGLPGSTSCARTPHMCERWAPCWRACTWRAQDFPLHQPNLRGLAWWTETVPVVLPFLTRRRSAALLETELAFQQQLAASPAFASAAARRRSMPTCSATT